MLTYLTVHSLLIFIFNEKEKKRRKEAKKRLNGSRDAVTAKAECVGAVATGGKVVEKVYLPAPGAGVGAVDEQKWRRTVGLLRPSANNLQVPE